MIKACSGDRNYQVHFSNGRHAGIADTTGDKGGANSGFRPHDLLEAALASCLVMWLKIYGDSHNIDTQGVEATVVLDRSKPEEAIFEYCFSFPGRLSEEEKQKLSSVARSCPVHRTLSRTIVVRSGGQPV